MNGVEEVSACCPYCGEPITLLIDCSIAEQRYIEDCEVCCRPMNVLVAITAEGLPQVSLTHENE